MNRYGIVFSLVLSIISAQGQVNNKQTNLIDSNFINPPVIARPKALWPWVNGNFSLSQISYELREAKEKGMAGFDIWDCGILVDPDKVVPAGPTFLGDASLQAIAHTVREADKLGLEIGLISSSSWNAGGAWVKPEHGAMGLFRSDTILQGPATFSGTIPFPALPQFSNASHKAIRFTNSRTGLPEYYKEVALIAHPYNTDSTINTSAEVKDLKTFVNAQGALRWEIPAGLWRIVRYVCIPTGQPLAIPSPKSNGLVLDHFSAAAQEANMNYIFSRLKSVLGNLNNRSLKYLYEDSYEVNSAVWTPELPEAFLHRFRYSLNIYLPVLDGFRVGATEETTRFQYDFRKLLSDLIIKNHYRKGREMSKKEGLGFYAEAGGPGQPIHNVPFEDLKALGSLTVPRGEFWNKHPQLELLQIVKGISSAAHIYNQRYAEAEAFTSVWLWQEGPGELKALADRAMCEGLNRFVYHTFPHTPPESGKPGWIYNFGTIINTTNGWWDLSKGFHDYIARSCYLLQQGNFRGDVAYYYGDQAPNFVPPKHIPADLGEGYDYDVVNSDIILNAMAVRNNRIYLPHGQYYEVLVLPNEQSMDPAVLKKVMQLVQAGATVIGAKPVRAYSLSGAKAADQSIKDDVTRLWGKCDSVHIKENKFGSGKIVWGKSVREVLLEKGINPDLEYTSAGSDSLDFIHRTDGQREIYFVRNKKKTQYSGTLSFRLTGKSPEFWKAEDGSQSRINHYSVEKGRTKLKLNLSGEESCFIIFQKTAQSSPASVPETSGGGTLVHSGNRTVKLENAEQVLSGPWSVKYNFNAGLPVTDTLDKLSSWNSSTDSLKYFAGKAIYENEFNWSGKRGEPLFLEILEVKEIARVYLNGELLGDHWHPSHRFDITEKIKTGKNLLTIEVVSTINNWLVGEARKPAQYRGYRSNITKLSNAWRIPFADAPLIDAGLIGPVQLRKGQLVK